MADKLNNHPNKEIELKKNVAEIVGRSDVIFKLLVETVVDYAIFALDINGHIRTWNKGAQRLKGYSSDEIIGKHFSTFYTEKDILSEHPLHELKYATEHGVFEEEGWRIKKNGERFWANVVITKLLDESGEHIGFAKVTRDLTERKTAEENLRELNEGLEKKVAQRTEELKTAVKARESFLSIASHELKTPLTSLKLKTQMRVRTFQKKPDALYEAQELIEMFKSDEMQINRLTRLVDDILDTTRIDAGKLGLQAEPVKLCSLIKSLTDNLGPQLQAAHCQVVFECMEEIEGLWDSYRLEQVFVNLMTNAMRYGAQRPINVRVGKKEKVAYFSVEDHGIGISSLDQERIFQQFERATTLNEGKGLGLGLYIVRQIIEAHGGKIHLKSEVNKGSLFTVELPL